MPLPLGKKERQIVIRGKKTEMMLAAEKRLGQSLEKALPEMVTQHGLVRTAERLRVSKATLSYWLLKLGIQTIRVALSPRETLKIKRAPLARRSPQRIA